MWQCQWFEDRLMGNALWITKAYVKWLQHSLVPYSCTSFTKAFQVLSADVWVWLVCCAVGGDSIGSYPNFCLHNEILGSLMICKLRINVKFDAMDQHVVGYCRYRCNGLSFLSEFVWISTIIPTWVQHLCNFLIYLLP